MATKNVPYDYIVIDEPRLLSTCEAFFKWKDLNSYLKSISNRGLNMPDAISEPLGCYIMGYVWNRGSSGDATDVVLSGGVGKRKIEFKASSNFDSDLTSFGPDTDFDDLVFLRFSLHNNLLFVYDLHLNHHGLGRMKANSTETVADQQAQGRRPRLRLIEDYIIPGEIAPTKVFNIVTRKTLPPMTFEDAEKLGNKH